MTDVSFDQVSRLLFADFQQGKLFWNERPREMFSADRLFNSWNARYSGTEAFTNKTMAGYYQGSIFGKKYLAHRVIWLLNFGAWPDQQVDHINGRRDDNRIVNLRAVSNQENHKNQRLSSRNTSGVSGVYWNRKLCKWQARIMVDGVDKHLGVFTEFEMAVSKRLIAEEQNGFHPNHGRSLSCL